MAGNGSADLRSPENEVYFRSWDLAHHQIYKSIFDAQKLIKRPYICITKIGFIK
jgi:hypothetical protein